MSPWKVEDHSPLPKGQRRRPVIGVVTLGIALALLGIFAAQLAFPAHLGLVVVSSLVVLVAALWLLGLGLRLAHGDYTRQSAAIEREAGLRREAVLQREADFVRVAEQERAAAIEQIRRLTESSFVAGSDALLRVRAVLRTLHDCRQRLGDGQHRLMDAQHPPEDLSNQSPAIPATIPAALVFDSLLTDIGRLTACARGLLPLAAAAETAAGAPGSTAGSPPAPAPSKESRPPDGHLLIAALKLRALAAELEHGLLGLSTEMRVLKRARLARPSVNGVDGGRRSGPDPSWMRMIERLEAQMTEAAEHVAGFTRDAEHLSRELDRLR